MSLTDKDKELILQLNEERLRRIEHARQLRVEDIAEKLELPAWKVWNYIRTVGAHRAV